MYPLIRFAKEMLKYRNAPKLGPLEAHISTHMCLPWDIDPWRELNNGRTLTLYDLGRLPLAARAGLIKVLRDKGWGLTVAGNSTRYRKRIRMFARFTMISRVVGWDQRFVYIDQSMWISGECCNQVLIRAAVTSERGIVPPALLIEALGHGNLAPELPQWVQAWSEADRQRPWPPEVPPDAKQHLSQ